MINRRHFTALSLASLAVRAQAQGTDFAKLADDFLEALWKLDPDAAIAAGRYDGAARLALPSKAQRQQNREFCAQWLARFEAVAESTLDTSARMDRTMLIAGLQSMLWSLDSLREWAWNPAQHNVAGALDLILSTDYAPLPQRLHDLAQRLALVPAYYREAAASLSGVTREHTQLALQQAPGVLLVLDEIAKEADKAGHQRELAAPLAKARAAVKGYMAHLRKLKPTRSFRLGAALYEPKFKHDVQSARSAKETYDLALQRREEVLTAMAAQAQALWPSVMGSAPQPADRFALIGQVIDKLSSKHVARERFVDEIRAQIPQLEAWIREKDLLTLDPEKPLVVRETPEYQRGVAGAGIDAPGPYRPQDRTYYNVTPLDASLTAEQAESTLREYNHWILQILNIHEAVPGHYTQLIYANRAPSKVKAIFGNGAMIEGWAVYGERMMIESGYGAQNGDHGEMSLMWGKWHLRAVTNTLLDYGVHVLGMSEKDALDLLIRQAFQTEQEAKEKWHRVQVTSVQLTSYFSGYSEIYALRQALQKRPGFDLKRFHEQFLSYGSAPVRLIAGEMLKVA